MSLAGRPSASSVPPADEAVADERIQQEAARWFARLRGEQVSDARRAAFARWLEADSRHRREFDILEQIWRASAQLRPQAAGRPRPLRAARTAVGVTSIALVCVWLGWTGLDGRMTTGAGEQRHLQLADGSELDMAPNTRLRARIGSTRRRLELEAGQIVVSVAADAARPFEVATNGGVIRDVGTRFGVDAGPNRTQVVVAEGMIEIDVPATGVPPSRVAAGEAAEFDGRAVSPPRPIDAAMALAWTKGQLVFDAAPLADVVAMLNRYRKSPIRLADPALQAIRISGVFLTDDESGALRALERVAPIEFVADGATVRCRLLPQMRPRSRETSTSEAGRDDRPT